MGSLWVWASGAGIPGLNPGSANSRLDKLRQVPNFSAPFHLVLNTVLCLTFVRAEEIAPVRYLEQHASHRVDTHPRWACRQCLLQNSALLAALSHSPGQLTARPGFPPASDRLVMSAVAGAPCGVPGTPPCPAVPAGYMWLPAILPPSGFLLQSIILEKLLTKDSRPRWHSPKPLGPAEYTRRPLLESRTLALPPTACSYRLDPANGVSVSSTVLSPF